MCEAGLDLTGSDLALAAASHSGEPFHVAGVRGFSAGAGLDETDLRCPPDLPYGEEARVAHLATGGGPQRIPDELFGKHAAMLRTCVTNDWPLDSTLDPGHRCRCTSINASPSGPGADPQPTSVDGCGAPLWGLPLVALARAMVGLQADDAGPTRRGCHAPLPGVQRRHDPRRHAPDARRAGDWSPKTARRPCRRWWWTRRWAGSQWR